MWMLASDRYPRLLGLFSSGVFFEHRERGIWEILVGFAFFDTKMRTDKQKNQDPFNRRLWQHVPFHSLVVRVMILRNACLPSPRT